MVAFVLVATAVAFLIAHSLILDEIVNQINDARIGPYISATGVMAKGRRWGPSPWKKVFERHRELFPTSRLRVWSKVLNAVAIVFVATIFVFWIAADRSQTETQNGPAVVHSAS
jgi:hypothetical protein